MPLSTITVTTSAGTAITQKLSAFGPNLTQAYNNLQIYTVQSPVTAFVTSYAFQNVQGYHAAEGNVFTIAPAAFGTLPAKLTNSGLTLALTASVGQCAYGVHTGSLLVTLSSQALSGASGSVSAVGVATTTQTISFPLTAINLPYHHHLCRKRFDRLRHNGSI